MKTAEELEVRPVIFSIDAADILDIERRLFDEESRWQATDFTATLRDGGQMLCVLVDDLVVGYVVWIEGESADDVKYAEILSIAVHPQYQRQKFGSLLIDALITESKLPIMCIARESSLDLHCFLRSHNIPARRVIRRAYVTEDGYLFQESRQPSR